MRCIRMRNLLLAGRPASDIGVEDHLASCERCAAFARRLALARQSLQRQQPEMLPDNAFVARVMSQLPRPSEVVGWIAARALPAALLLALLLIGFGAAESLPSPVSLLFEDPSRNQILAWSVQDQAGENW
jgi:anti-sigma factor RsiW